MNKENVRSEMDLASGSAKRYGSSRSIVRRIATSLPLKPCPRVQFQLNSYAEDGSYLRAPTRQNFLVTSLADVGWIAREDDDEEDEEYFDMPRPGPSTGLVFRLSQPQSPKVPMARPRSLPSLHQVDPDPQGPAASNNEANRKISALEEELAKLRVQIAQIVLAQERSTQSEDLLSHGPDQGAPGEEAGERPGGPGAQNGPQHARRAEGHGPGEAALGQKGGGGQGQPAHGRRLPHRSGPEAQVRPPPPSRQRSRGRRGIHTAYPRRQTAGPDALVRPALVEIQRQKEVGLSSALPHVEGPCWGPELRLGWLLVSPAFKCRPFSHSQREGSRSF